MKHLSSSLVLLSLLWGIVGESAAIAIASTPSQNSQFDNIENNNINNRTPIRLAQQLGRQGECRAVTRETQIYAENSIRALTGIYLNENDIVQLLENNRTGKRLIAVSVPQRNISGYVETSDLKLCPPTPVNAPFTTAPSTVPFTSVPATVPFRTVPAVTVPFTTIPSTQFRTLPSTQFNTVPLNTIPLNTVPFNTTPAATFSLSSNRCQVTQDTNLYGAPGSNQGEFLEVGIDLTVDPQRSGTANNIQWIHATTPFGDSGWVMVNRLGCR